MRPKQIVLLIFIIVAGVIFYHVQTGKIDIDGNLEDFIGLGLVEFTATESQVIEPPFPASLRIINVHGDVEVQGTESEKITVTLEKKVWRKDEEKAKEALDSVHLVVDKDEQAVVLKSNREELKPRHTFIGVSRSFETNIRVSAPLNMDVDIVNSHGLAQVTRAGKVAMRNPHGEVIASEVSGEIQIENSYEDVKLSDLRSNCLVEGSHSSVYADGVQGEMRIKTSYSTVQVRKASQKVVIDGRHTEIIGEELSGPLDITNSYEKISLARVGQTKIEGHHSEIEADDVSGGLEIRDDYASANLSNIRGNLKISGRNLSVSGKNVVGEEIFVSTSYDNIELAGFSGKTTLLQSHGDVILEPLPLTGHIEVRGEYSTITFYWPEGEQYPLEAQTRNGDIHWRLAQEIAVEEKNSFTVAKAFQDLKEKPGIVLFTTYNDIFIEAGSPLDKK